MSPTQERLRELLADRATVGLEHESQRELEHLRDAFPELDEQTYERAAAAIALSSMPATTEAMPARLREKLRADAEAFFDRRAQRTDPPDETREVRALAPAPAPAQTPAPAPAPVTPLAWAGWAAAAALALTLFLVTRDGGGANLDPASRREQLLLTGGDTVQVAWSSTEDELGAGVEGDVVWSDGAQQGYMRFRGLEANDPTRKQYQLWIFDKDRPAETPVDGGVFDILPGEDEAVVAIDPKIEVTEATLFAVTLEDPGGVVVSKRERLLLLAQR